MSDNGSGGAPKRHIQKISGYDVIIQACWVDEDLDIIANISVGDTGELIHARQVQITGNAAIEYIGPTFKRLGRRMTETEFDSFLKDNFRVVIDLITSLLEPGELILLQNEQARDAIQPDLFGGGNV